MICTHCLSAHERELYAEINIHSQGLDNIDDPGLLVFPTITVCLDCGLARFVVPQCDLPRLDRRIPDTRPLKPSPPPD
jgi:hypothetical protein